MKPHDLPVYKAKERILQAIKSNQVIIVESPTGSGKTTQIPIILHEAGYSSTGVIGVTQPRRIAALSVSEYLSKQLGTTFPGFVGYKMRFEDQTNEETHIKIMTDGILLQEVKYDRFLNNYQVLMIDEAHERSLNIDFIMGLVKQILPKRPDLKIIISSATLNTQIFSEYFDGAPILNIETPVYPVEILYKPLETKERVWTLEDRITAIIKDRVHQKKPGDILVFLSGERIIKDTMTKLYSEPFHKDLHIMPLYGRLSKEEQEKVFDPTPKGKTKIVLSTNIAETSVTIDGITAVIDSGLAKINYYSPRNYTSSLIEEPISKASSNQRKGRAGRTQAGDCYRLYSKSEFNSRPLFTKEEIYRTDLSEVVLRMAEFGIKEFENFDFISPPGASGILGAIEILKMLEALTPERELSEIGKMMTEFPLLPRQSRMIVESIYKYPEVLRETIKAAAFLSTNSPYLLPQGEELDARRAHHTFRDPMGDFVSYLRLFKAFQNAHDKEKFCKIHYLELKTMRELANISTQLEEIVNSMGIPVSEGGPLPDYIKSIAKGNLQFLCIRTGRGIYRSVTADQILIHPGSVLFRENPQFIVAGEVVKTSRMYARSVSPIEKSWLKEVSYDLSEALFKSAQGKGKRSESRERREESRDFTFQVKVGDVVFPLKTSKRGRKVIELDWETLKGILNKYKIKDFLYLKKMHASLTYKGEIAFKETKALELLKILKNYSLDKNYIENPPRSKTYFSERSPSVLLKDIDLILKLVPLKKKATQMGFLALETDTQGTYWFKIARSFLNAVDISLGSLECLADELGDNVSKGQWENFNRIYRQLNIYYSI